MSFDVFFQPAQFSDDAIEQTNPFTGEVLSVVPMVPLAGSELDAVRQVLKGATSHGPDDFGCHVVKFQDGGVAQIFASELERGCMAALRGITPDLLQFLYDMLVAGRWVMLPAMENPVSITTPSSSVSGLPEDFLEVVECKSAAELGVLLNDGFQTWKKYRDQVLGGE